MIKNIIKIVLLIVIIGLVYLVYESVMRPVRFNKQKDSRNLVVIQNLKDIRISELSFKAINGKYTADFDTLIDFLKRGVIPVVNIIPDPEDTTFTKTINDTIDYVNVADSLFKDRVNFIIEDIQYVPFTDGEMFKLAAGEINKGGVSVNVFEASIYYKVFLSDMDKQMVKNFVQSREDINKYPGLKVGSMIEASTDGNWE
ncbi:MAG: hypothetical protein K8R58_04200 [Bacteroidales bacterium]|nr:hypothetical protein [Bacteroidales bacterium]